MAYESCFFLSAVCLLLLGCAAPATESEYTPTADSAVDVTEAAAQPPTATPTAATPQPMMTPTITKTPTSTPVPTETPDLSFLHTPTPEATPRWATLESTLPGLAGTIYFLWDANLIPPPDERGIGEVAETRLYEVGLDDPRIQSVFGEYGKPKLRAAPNSTQLAMTQSFDEDNDRQIDTVNLHIYQVMNGVVAQLTNDDVSRISFNWSPTSTSLVYSQEGTVRLLTIKTMTTEKIAELPDRITQLVWSPKQDYLAVNRFPNNLDLIDLKNGQVTNLLSDVDYTSNLAWSIDGKWLYISDRADQNLSLVNVETATITSLMNPQMKCRSAWSPATVELAYACDDTLYLWSAETQATVEIHHEETLGSPAWSPDGETIAVGFMQEGQPELLLVQPQNGQISRYPSVLYPSELLWSPDGNWLLFLGVHEDKEGLMIVRKESGRQFWLQETTGSHAPYDIHWIP